MISIIKQQTLHNRQVYGNTNQLMINLYNPPMSQTDEDRQFTQFITAIKNGSIDDIEANLRTAPPSIVNRIQSQFRQPSLYFAALTGKDQLSAQLIKLLVRHGANVSFKDHNEQTILFYICREGKQICAELLLSHGLSLDDTDVYGQTPLFYAVSQNRLNIVSKYATKERCNHVDKLAKQTPLYYAARKGHLEMAILLIEKGADVSITDSTNKTAVEYARKGKYNEVASFLNSQLKKIKDLKGEDVEKNKISGTIKKKDEISKEAKNNYKLVHYNQKGQVRDLTEQEVRQLMAERPDIAAYLENPSSIPTDEEEDSWDKAASRVLNLCYKSKGAYHFLEPVDPVKYNIMDYFDIVKHPMDLSTVKKRLSHNFYKGPSEFMNDMNLIWNNSYSYNGHQHVVSRCAKDLEEGFNQLVVSQGLDKYLNGQSSQQVNSDQKIFEDKEEIDILEKGKGDQVYDEDLEEQENIKQPQNQINEAQKEDQYHYREVQNNINKELNQEESPIDEEGNDEVDPDLDEMISDNNDNASEDQE